MPTQSPCRTPRPYLVFLQGIKELVRGTLQNFSYRLFVWGAVQGSLLFWEGVVSDLVALIWGLLVGFREQIPTGETVGFISHMIYLTKLSEWNSLCEGKDEVSCEMKNRI